MQYYCAYCNRLDKIEPSAGEDATVCNQCGHTLTALTEVAKPVSSAPRRLGLIILIGVTGFLLGILWYSGRDLLNPLKGLVHEGSFLDEANCICFPGCRYCEIWTVAPHRELCSFYRDENRGTASSSFACHTRGETASGEREHPYRTTDLLPFSGASVGTILTVLVIGFLIFIAWAILGSFYDWLNRPGKV